MKMSRVSASRLEVFEMCPLHYRFKYHDEIPEKGEMPAAQFGSWIHKALELHVKDGTDLQTAMKSCVNEYQFGHDLLNEVPKIMRNFCRINKDLPAGKTEFEFSLDAGFGVPVNGVIDRLIPNGDRTFVLDYKTGRFQKTAKQLRSNYQMLIYAWASSQLAKISPDRVDLALAYLRSGDLVQVSFTVLEVEIFLDQLKERVALIRGMEPEKAKAKPGGACNLCGYSADCKACQIFRKLRR